MQPPKWNGGVARTRCLAGVSGRRVATASSAETGRIASGTQRAMRLKTARHASRRARNPSTATGADLVVPWTGAGPSRARLRLLAESHPRAFDPHGRRQRQTREIVPSAASSAQSARACVRGKPPGVPAMILSPLLTPALVTVSLTAVAVGLRGVLLKQLTVRMGRRGADSLDLLHRALRLPSLLWSLVLGLYGGTEVATLPPRLTARLLLVLHVLIVVSVTITAANLLAALVVRFGERRTLAVGVTGLARTAVRALVWTVGLLI